MADAALPEGYVINPGADSGGVALPEGYNYDPNASAQQMKGAWRIPALVGSNAAKGALESAGAFGDIQDLARGLALRANPALSPSPVGNPQNQLATTPYTRPAVSPTQGSPFSSAALVGLGQSLGAVNRPDLQPQTAGERYLAAGSEGAGGAAPYLPFAGSIPGALRLGAQGIGAGLGGQAGADLYPDYAGAARAAGGLTGLYGGGKLFDIGNAAAGVLGGATTPTLQAYRNLGIDPRLAGDVTGRPALQMLQTYAAKAPGGANTIHAASEDAINQWGNALEDTASGLGNSRTLQQAGTALQGESQNWLDRFRTASRQAWGQVDSEIPPNTPVPLTNYANTLSAVRSRMPNAPATAARLQPTISRDLLDSLIQDTQARPLTWQDATGIRTSVGEMLSEPQIVGDTAHADLRRIYGALSSDLGATAAAQGPAAQAAFDNASAITRNGHGFIDNVLSSVIRGNQIAPQNAANTILNTGRNGDAMLGAIRREMPRAADELAAYKLRDMGLATAGQQNAEGTRISPGTFLTDRATTLSPEALNALFGADPAAMQNLRDLSTTAESMRATQRFLNTSNTGTHSAVAHAMGSAVAAPITGIEAYHAGGWPAAMAAVTGSLALPYVPSWLAAQATTNPALTAILSRPPMAALPLRSRYLSVPTTVGATAPEARGLFGE